jgi:hypothetical protein
MWGWAFSSRPAADAARSIMRASPAVVNGDPRSLTKTKGDAGLSRSSRRRERSSSPWIGWVPRGAVLDPADVQGCAGEVNLVPTQVADLGSPQPVPVGEEDHRRVTMAVTVVPRGLEQGLDLAWGQVLSGPELGVLLPLRAGVSKADDTQGAASRSRGKAGSMPAGPNFALKLGEPSEGLYPKGVSHGAMAAVVHSA